MRMRKKQWAEPELMQCDYFKVNAMDYKGKWKEAFKKDQSMAIELGCGKSTFTAVLGERNPNINYLAIDIKMDILGVARRNISEHYESKNKQVDNLILTIFDIDKIKEYIDENDQFERIYINFCNPWPRGKHHKKRLTHTRQLEKYKMFLKLGGEIHFKTDDTPLFNSTLYYLNEVGGYEIVYQTRDLHNSEYASDNIMSEHETRFTEQGIKTKFLIAKLVDKTPKNKEENEMDKPLYICYNKCSTCAKAKKFLEENNTQFVERPIKEQNPTADELKVWIAKSNLPIKRFFNTSGVIYKEMKLKDKLETMTDEEKIELLATDGMLVKRPILVTQKGVFPGFKEEEWKKIL